MGVPVSVIVPVHNSEAFLGELVGSVLAQTMGDFELICVDDGSTDGSPQALARAAAADARVRVVTQPCRGVSAARNAGLAAARGAHVLFADADDLLEPHLLELALARAGRDGSDVVVFGYSEWYAQTGVNEPRVQVVPEGLYDGAAPLAALTGAPAPDVLTPNVWRMLYRREFLAQEGISFPEGLRTAEDLVFVYEALGAAARISFMPDVLYRYRRDGAGSATKTDRGTDACGALALIRGFRGGLYPNTPGLDWHFANLVLDVFNYHLYSAVTWSEFSGLWGRLQGEWLPYVEGRAGLEPWGHHADFLAQVRSLSAEEFLMEVLYAPTRVGRERADAELNAARREAGAARADAGAVRASHAYRIGRTITWLPHKLRAAVKGGA